MTADVFRAFEHEHNRPEVARQEYEAAKEHYHEMVSQRNPLDPEHNRRFRDAAERLDAARERWLGVL